MFPVDIGVPGRNSQDCSGHALHRWYTLLPHNRINQTPPFAPHHRLLGRFHPTRSFDHSLLRQGVLDVSFVGSCVVSHHGVHTALVCTHCDAIGVLYALNLASSASMRLRAHSNKTSACSRTIVRNG